MERSGGDEFVGFLDIGDDIGGLPQRIGRYRLPADGPVSALARAGHADDVEFHMAAKRMTLKGVSDPALDLIDGRRCFCKKRLEIHVTPPATAASLARATVLQTAFDMNLGGAWLIAG